MPLVLIKNTTRIEDTIYLSHNEQSHYNYNKIINQLNNN